MITEQEVLEALKEVYDPEIPVNLVDLGLIYGAKISPENKVEVTMTLTTKGCGMSYQIAMQVKQRVLRIPGVSDATVTVVWEPAWSPDKMSDAAKKKLGINA